MCSVHISILLLSSSVGVSLAVRVKCSMHARPAWLKALKFEDALISKPALSSESKEKMAHPSAAVVGINDSDHNVIS